MLNPLNTGDALDTLCTFYPLKSSTLGSLSPLSCGDDRLCWRFDADLVTGSLGVIRRCSTGSPGVIEGCFTGRPGVIEGCFPGRPGVIGGCFNGRPGVVGGCSTGSPGVIGG